MKIRDLVSQQAWREGGAAELTRMLHRMMAGAECACTDISACESGRALMMALIQIRVEIYKVAFEQGREFEKGMKVK